MTYSSVRVGGNSLVRDTEMRDRLLIIILLG